MSLFSKYRPPGYKFYEPERYTPSIARARRLNALLEQDRRFAELPNFKQVQVALSQAPKTVSVKTRKVVNDAAMTRHKAALIAAAAAEKYRASGFRDKLAFEQMRYHNFLAARLAAASRGFSKVSGADKRRFNPTGKHFAVRRSGLLAGMYAPAHAWVQVFKNPGEVIPCIQRDIRRQVMFAKGFGGRGFKVKHRRTWASGVPC